MTTGPSVAPQAETADEKLQRRMKIVVAVLGALIVLGLLLVIGRVVYLASRGAPASVAASQGGTIAPEASLVLPAGAQVKSVSINGNRLAVHFEAPSGAGFAVLDLETGRTLSRVRLVPEPPRN